MKNVMLRSLELENFRGAKKSTTYFGEITEISGENGSGKTRHFDAFVWLLFGKDSLDRKDFEIKTRTADGGELHKVDCRVKGVLEVDGTAVTIERAIVEDWVKPRGQQEQVFKGNHTECWWNGTPVKVSEYDNRVKGIIDPTLFKMLTNPMYFATMDWKLQREQLFQLAGTVSDEEMSARNPDYKALLDKISGKPLADFKTELSARKKRLKAELEEIQPRIDQTHKMMPEPADWDALEKQVAELDKSIATIDESVRDVAAAMRQSSQALLDKQREIDQLKVKCQQLEFAAKAKAREDAYNANATRREINQKLRDKENEWDSAHKQLAYILGCQAQFKEQLEQRKERQEVLRAQWVAENAKQWQGDTKCPTCGQTFPDDMLEQIREEFAKNQQQVCADIAEQGKAIGKGIEELTESIAEQQKDIDRLTFQTESLQGDIERYKNDIATMPADVQPVEVKAVDLPDYLELQIKIKELEKEVAEAKPTADTSEMDAQRKEFERQRQATKLQLAQRGVIARYSKEIEELEARGKELAGQIAEAEKDEYIMQQFTQKKIEECEKRINGMFKVVTFRLFDYTIDGNPIETCVPLVDGVPYGCVNTAGQINAGLDIINTLSTFHGVAAPIFCDHAESVNTFTETNCQMILLKVSDTELVAHILEKLNN